MGYSDFLLGISGAKTPTLDESISVLHDASTLFVAGFTNKNLEQCDRATRAAMKIFDHIVGEITRIRDERMGDNVYLNTPFHAELQRTAGQWVSPVTRNEHVHLTNLGPGNGQMPNNLGPIIPLSMEKTLMKIKHKNANFGNFRVSGAKHFFYICPDKQNPKGQPDGILEIEVQLFCSQLSSVSNSI